ncbi:hypothetical protein OVS_04250 [Mycoplasma ovis str. Michigan]|uniref:Uncharacterized protein n=1 Tax=Mycoplasma ovis str. Michigan TaxID=1415773 RepID=A0ABN4BRU4_9MOLU|nr:hypothetical protein OVS_04250 [Mycoplasma ovis str. Michigan]
MGSVIDNSCNLVQSFCFCSGTSSEEKASSTIDLDLTRSKLHLKMIWSPFRL